MPPTAAELENYRRSLDLRIDGNGQLLHEGHPVAHPGVRQALLDGLDLLPNGEACIRIGAQWAYVQCAFTPFVVQRAEILPDGVRLRLNTGRTVHVAAADLNLRLHRDTVLLLDLAAGGPPARCSHAAWMQLADHLLYVGERLQLQGAGWVAAVAVHDTSGTAATLP